MSVRSGQPHESVDGLAGKAAVKLALSSGAALRKNHPRERILEAAYELLCAQSFDNVSADKIIAHSGVAKVTFYRQFASKEALVVAFLEMRSRVWTDGWLRSEVRKHAKTPVKRLLAIFDVFESWFHQPDFSGCPLIRALLEAPIGSAIHAAAAKELEHLRLFVKELADEAGLDDSDAFAKAWHLLMTGSITSAFAGERRAAKHASFLGVLILEGWRR